MTLKYIITGATGGLGGGVLQQLSKHVPKSDIAASSSRPEAAKHFEPPGIQFRHADYQDRASLEKAFTGTLHCSNKLIVLKRSSSGIVYTSVREGIYAEAFPLFLNYYPSLKVLHLPNDGPVAYASRAELAEATANLMMQDGYEKEMVLLTGPKAVTLADLVVAINEATGKSIVVETLPPKEYVKASAKGDQGGRGEW
ncbi:hypothetical protein OEA41_007518 [Lepraria neglecta]|uniref:NAD(P)-binding domain-containing protein n=1 Tax=Lepraria neglecta TaxID=209136 RepID=A0AAD9ZDR1_9LECA|nr:hypothetical protein OEA41_007518 [Lepraria neglecta]